MRGGARELGRLRPRRLAVPAAKACCCGVLLLRAARRAVAAYFAAGACRATDAGLRGRAYGAAQRQRQHRHMRRACPPNKYTCTTLVLAHTLLPLPFLSPFFESLFSLRSFTGVY